MEKRLKASALKAFLMEELQVENSSRRVPVEVGVLQQLLADQGERHSAELKKLNDEVRRF